jgi:hypothetical protein
MCNVSNYNFTRFIGSPYTGLVRVRNAFLANLKKTANLLYWTCQVKQISNLTICQYWNLNAKKHILIDV